MALLHENIDAEALEPRYSDGEVAFELASEFLALRGMHHRVGQVAPCQQRALADRDWQVRQAAEDLLAPD